MASTQALPSDVHATIVEQVEKDKEDIPLSKEDDKKTVIEETPEIPELVAATTTADDKQPESVIGTEAEKEAPIVEVDSKEVDISAPKTEQEPEPVSIKEEEKPVIEVKEKEVATEVHEVAKSEAEKLATESVAEAIEDKAEKATSEVAPEPVIEATIENVEAVVEHEEKPTAEAAEDVPVVEAEEKPAAEAVQDPELEIKNLAELVTPEPVTIEGHVEAVVEQEEKPITEAIEDVPVVEPEEKPSAETVQDPEPEIKNLAELVTPEPVTIEGHVEAVVEHEEKPIAEAVEDVPVVEAEEKPAAEAVQDSGPEIKNIAEHVTQEPVAIEGHVEAVAENEEKLSAEVVEDVPSEKNGAEVKEESTTVTKLAEQVTQAVDEVKPDAPTEEAKNGDDGTVTSSRDMATEEVVVKTKQSSNIMAKVKQSLVKVKKAIIGKSPSSKALSAETKVEVKAK